MRRIVSPLDGIRSPFGIPATGGTPPVSTANTLIWASGNNLTWASGNNLIWGTA